MSLEYSMIVKLLTEQHLEFLSLKGGWEARMSLHLSKCHIVGNHMSWFFTLKEIEHRHEIKHNMTVGHEKTQISLGTSKSI